MAIVLADRVKQTTATTGSGTIALSGTFGGFQGFSAIGDGNETFYCVENYGRWEVGIGTYSNAGTLTRDTVLKSSAGGVKINMQGLSTVFCTYPADRTVFTNASGFLDLSANSGLVFPDNMNLNDVTISGNLNITPYGSKMTTFIRTTSGNFFQAYVDDAYDRTIALYTDATSSPKWRLGVKNSPTYNDQPPTYGYVCGEDGCVGLNATATSSFEIKHATGFTLTHQSTNLLTGSKVNGITVGVPTIGTALSTAGSGSMAALTVTSGVVFSNGLQSQAFLGLQPTSGQAAYASGQINNVSADLLVVSGIASAHTTDYSSNILANSASGVAISGWAAGTFLTSYTDTTYTAGSGMSLVGTIFHWTESGVPIANSGYAESVYLKEHPSISAASSSSNTGRTYIQNITLDSNGHITAMTSGTETVTDTDTTYTSGSGITLQGGVFHATNTFAADILANSQSGVVISGIAAAGGTMYSAGSGLSLVGTTFHWTESGIPIANSGYFESKIAGLPDNDTTYTAGSGMALVGNVFHFTDSGAMLAGDIAVSGWVAAQGYVTTDTNTTYTAGSGLTLVGTEFNWTESGIPIANSGYFETKIAGLPDNDTTYTAGSGMELVGTVFHWTESGVPIANSGYFQGQLDSLVDNDTTYTAGSGVELVGTTFHVSSNGGSGTLEGLTVDKAIKTKINTEADGATITFNMNDSNTHMATLGGNRTIAVSNAASGQKFMLRLKQDGTGSRTVTWFSDIKWENGSAPTLSSVANHADWFGFVCTSGGYYDGCVIMSGVR